MANKTPGRRTRNLFDPNSKEPFKLSRTKIELFTDCPRCFYLDRRLGVGRPGFPPYTLNSAVDTLLKKEFDIHRAKGSVHPLMKKYGVEAVPFEHEDIDKWRENFVGVQFLHKKTNLLIFGAVDDIWVDEEGNLYVVDYKATSTLNEISLDDEYKQAYKRQMEIYQWLLRNNKNKHKHEVSDLGYFVFANASRDRKAFDGKLEFAVQIIPYQGSDKWVDKIILDAHKCLMSDRLPEPSSNCKYCNYRQAAQEFES